MLALKLTEHEQIIIDVDGERITLRFYWRAFDGYDDPYIAISAKKEWRTYREKRVHTDVQIRTESDGTAGMSRTVSEGGEG